MQTEVRKRSVSLSHLVPIKFLARHRRAPFSHYSTVARAAVPPAATPPIPAFAEGQGYIPWCCEAAFGLYRRRAPA